MRSEHILFKKPRSGSIHLKKFCPLRFLSEPHAISTPHIRDPPLPRAQGGTGEIKWDLGKALSQAADRIYARTTEMTFQRDAPSLVCGRTHNNKRDWACQTHIRE